ncbi:hypothetical protein EMIT047CA2_60068 [Pseudomonas soli]
MIAPRVGFSLRWICHKSLRNDGFFTIKGCNFALALYNGAARQLASRRGGPIGPPALITR